MQIIVRKPTDEEQKIALSSWSDWTKEPSEFDWSYSDKETCLILEGEAEVIAKTGEYAHFRAGDYVIFPKGLECTWKIKNTIKKKYLFG
jgi:uncharacterized protein